MADPLGLHQGAYLDVWLQYDAATGSGPTFTE